MAIGEDWKKEVFKNENERKAILTTRKAIDKLKEYGIKLDKDADQPSAENGWRMIIRFSIPETSLINETVGKYHMNKQEDMIECFKQVYIQGVTATSKATGNIPVGRKYEDMFKFYCRVRTGEVWTHRDQSYQETLNKMTGVYDGLYD